MIIFRVTHSHISVDNSMISHSVFFLGFKHYGVNLDSDLHIFSAAAGDHFRNITDVKNRLA